MFFFLVFTLFVCATYYLHFLLAHRAYRALRGQQSSEIDLHYVRAEDYFGHSFRSKLQDWLELPPLETSTPAIKEIAKGHERIYVVDSASYPDSSTESGILAVDGNFTTGVNCRFAREIYVGGNAEIGVNTRLQAIAVDGSLTLRHGVRVIRWVDSKGILDIRDRCRIHSRATSQTRIRLGLDARCLSACAPEVETQGRQETVLAQPLVRVDAVVIPPPGENRDEWQERDGFNPKLLFQLSSDCWLYDGNLRLGVPLHVRANLIVRGELECAEENLLEGDVRADAILIGASSLCKGNLVAVRDILIGRRTTFQGAIHAGGLLRLSRGVRGFHPGQSVVAYAGGKLVAEPNVVINGKLASSEYVQAVFGPSM